jgi:ABC-type transport system involved in Fe-S cluster assembly fused permease/ATPase subunit
MYCRAVSLPLPLQTVKLFCAEGLESGQYDQATRQYQAQEYFQLAFLSVLAIVQGAIVWGGLVAGTCVCVAGVAQGTLTVGG